MGKKTSKCVWSPTVPAKPPEELLEIVDAIFDQVNLNRESNKGLTTDVIDADQKACCWLVSALYEAAVTFPPTWAVLPRSKNRFVGDHAKGTTLPPYKSTIRAIEAAKSLGYVKELKNPYIQGLNQLASRMQASGLALKKIKKLGPVWRVAQPVPRINQILIGSRRKGTRRRLSEVERGLPAVQRLQGQLEVVNKLLAKTCVCLDVSDAMLTRISKEMVKKSEVESDSDIEIQRSEAGINYSERQLIRIFGDEHMNSGGRLYGGWWQGVPDRYRRNIIINDCPTVEIDFSGMAIRCLYARLGLAQPDDPYEIGLNYSGPHDEKRKLVKKYLTARLNDQGKRYRLPAKSQAVLGISRSQLDRRINEKHSPIAHFFGSKVGMELQFVDSEIAMGVLLRLAKKRIPCLPIHDSFIIAVQHELHLLEVMQQEFKRLVGTYCPVKVDRIPSCPVKWNQPWLPPPGQNIDSHIKYLCDRLSRFAIRQSMVASWYEWRRLNGARDHLVDFGFEDARLAWDLLRKIVQLPSDLLQAQLTMGTKQKTVSERC